MPLLLGFDSDHTIHHLTVSGTSTLPDWQDCLARMMAPPTTASPARVLIEFTTDAQPPHEREIPVLALLLRQFADQHHGRIALVGCAGHGVPLAMLTFSCDAPGRVQFCHSLADARIWLIGPRQDRH